MRKNIRVIAFLMVFCLCVSTLMPMKASAAWTPPTAPTVNAVYFVNEDTGTVLYAKNERQKIYPASVTKLMTAMLVYEKYKNNLNTKITVESGDITPLSGTYASVIGLKNGEQLTVEQLLYCLLVRSGDDSANVLARAAGGTVEEFVGQMNAKAKALGMKNTHFANPHGLHDDNHYTTAYDCYLLSKNAMKIDLLAKIVATTSFTLEATNKSAARKFTSTNFVINPAYKSFYMKNVKGIKTGTTTPAGACLVSYAQKDGVTYYCVTMGGTSDKKKNINTAFTDTRELYKWAFANFAISPLVKVTETEGKVKLDLALEKTKLMLVPEKQVNALVPKGYKVSEMKKVYHGPETVKAPIKKGQKIGTEDIFVVDPQTKQLQKVATVNLVAKEEVALSKPLYILASIKHFFTSAWFKVVAVVLVLALAAYITLSVMYNRRKKMLNKRGKKKYTYKR